MARRISGLSALLIAISFAPGANAQMVRLGANLPPLNYWQTDAKFVDYLSPLAAYYPPAPAGITLDNYHWPTSVDIGQAYSWVLPSTTQYMQPGRYRLSAKGTGTLYYAHPDLANPIAPWFHVTSPGKGIDQVIAEWDVTTTKAYSLLGIFYSDANDPLRDIHLYRADLDPGTTLFNPDYVATLKGFDTLRLAQWGGIIASTESTWPAFAGAPGGRPAQYAAAFGLANKTKANVWVCLPHLADENYATQLGKLANSMLRPGTTLYVEYSVECWNWGYPFAVETAYTSDYAVAHGLPHKEAGYVVLASRGIAAIKKAAPNLKVKGVYANQFAWADLANIGLGWARANNYIHNFDVLAVAPYVDSEIGDYTVFDAAAAAGDVDTATAEAMRGFTAGLAQIDSWGQDYEWISQTYGLPLVAYECGPSWNISSTAPPARAPMYQKVLRRPEMGQFLTNYYFPWMSKYFTMGNYYCFTSYWGDGSEWGINTYLGEPSSKLDAAHAYNALWKPVTAP
jgi:hypothetical protein